MIFGFFICILYQSCLHWREVTGQTWAVLLAPLLAGLQLIFYVHSSQSSEASADFCLASGFQHPRPNLYIQEQKEKRELEIVFERLRNPVISLAQPCPPTAVAATSERTARNIGSEVQYLVVSAVIAATSKMSQEMGELTQTRLQKIWIPHSSSRLQRRRGCKWGLHLWVVVVGVQKNKRCSLSTPALTQLEQMNITRG